MRQSRLDSYLDTISNVADNTEGRVSEVKQPMRHDEEQILREQESEMEKLHLDEAAKQRAANVDEVINQVQLAFS